MSLNIDCTRCKDQSEPAKETRHMWMSIVAHLMMFTGINSITEKNFLTTEERIALWESVGGPLAGDHYGPVTHDTLKLFVGCTTNVSRMTDHTFAARFNAYAGDIARRNFKRTQKEKAA